LLARGGETERWWAADDGLYVEEAEKVFGGAEGDKAEELTLT
jgi:hypothetical protein